MRNRSRYQHLSSRQTLGVNEDRRLSFANGQLCAVLDLVTIAFEAGHHGVPGVVGPVNDVDELAREEIENAHGGPRNCADRCNLTTLCRETSNWPLWPVAVPGRRSPVGHRPSGSAFPLTGPML